MSLTDITENEDERLKEAAGVMENLVYAGKKKEALKYFNEQLDDAIKIKLRMSREYCWVLKAAQMQM